MDPEQWDAIGDWPAMLRAVPDAPGRRKLRLWCVAWARLILARAADDPSEFARAGGWFTPVYLAGYGRELDTAEAFADGRVGRKALHDAKHVSGAPWNVFHLVSGALHMVAPL